MYHTYPRIIDISLHNGYTWVITDQFHFSLISKSLIKKIPPLCCRRRGKVTHSSWNKIGRLVFELTRLETSHLYSPKFSNCTGYILSPHFVGDRVILSVSWRLWLLKIQRMEISVSGETQVKITDLCDETLPLVVCTKGCSTNSVKKERRIPMTGVQRVKWTLLWFILNKASRGAELEAVIVDKSSALDMLPKDSVTLIHTLFLVTQFPCNMKHSAWSLLRVWEKLSYEQ